MDLFLVLYVLGLMFVFFLLGAAIGGALRCMKAYFFGVKEGEYVCAEAPSVKERALVETAAIGGAALAAQGAQTPEAGGQNDVVVSGRQASLDPVAEWVDDSSAADIVRDETGAAPLEAADAAYPLRDEEMQVDAGDDIAVERGAVVADDLAAESGSLQVEAFDAQVEDASSDEMLAPDEVIEDEPVLAALSEDEAPQAPALADESVEEGDDAGDAEILTPVADFVEEEPSQGEQEAAFDDQTSEADEAEADTMDKDETPAGDLSGDVAAAAAAAVLAGAAVASADAQDQSDQPLGEESAPLEAVFFTPQGEPDDLTLIQGIDQELEQLLNGFGVQNFSQIADLSEPEVMFLRENLAFTSDLNEQGWIEQAKILAAGGLTLYAQERLAPDEDTPQADDSPQADQGDLEAPVQDSAAQDADADTQDIEEPVAEADDGVILQGAVLEEEGSSEEEISSAQREGAAQNGDVMAAAAAAVLSRAGVAEVPSGEAEDEDVSPPSDDAVQQTDAPQSPLDETVDEGGALAQEEAPLDEAADEGDDQSDGRLFGRETRARRDEEWRQRYEGERRILPPHERESADDDVPSPEGVVAIPADSDDLKQIKYISTGLEKKLNLLGVYKLSQIAAWSDEDVASISDQLELRGRVREEDWIGQASAAMSAGLESAVDPASGEVAASGGLVSGLLSQLAELDQLEGMSEHEKTLLSKEGITRLSQVANWSGADMKWAADLLGYEDLVRVSGWVTLAKSLVSEGRSEGALTSTGAGDDLKRIRGIDEETELQLKEFGVMTYAEIAAFEQDDMDKVNAMLGTSGRVERQYWVVQAKVLRDGGDTDFSKLYDGSQEG